MSAYEPRPEHRFTFGLWTVGNVGRDPFGDPAHQPLDPVQSVKRLGELGAYGVSLHDNDLIPFGASAAERDRLVARFRAALDASGMRVTMATTNLFTHPIFKDGAFTANDSQVRRFALQKSMRAIDLGVELGAPTYVFWGGREGSEVLAAKPPVDALERYREALSSLCGYVFDQGYELRFALEPKPNEPRGDSFVSTVGHALALIDRLEHPELVGVNPEVAHETMAGLSFCHAVALALWAGKLFHIDLNSQRIGRFDQDLRFGQEDLKEAFLLVRLLEEAGYTGPRHFRRPRAESRGYEGGVGIRRRLHEDVSDPGRESAGAHRGSNRPGGPRRRRRVHAGRADDRPVLHGCCAGAAGGAVRLDTLAQREYANERLDQIIVERLLGA